MALYISKLIGELLLPPANILLLLVVSIILLKYSIAWAKRILIATTSLFFLLTLPITAMSLMSLIEDYPALDNNTIMNSSAQAIVILGGGRYADTPEYSGDTVSGSTMERLRYGAHLHRQNRLPILVTGGSPLEPRIPEAQLMANTLINELSIKPRWIEGESRTTAENALFSKALMERDNITEVFLVTHAWHLYRAVRMFEKQGIQVIPAPTAFSGLKSSSPDFGDFIPNAAAMRTSYYALHELLGQIWYKLRY